MIKDDCIFCKIANGKIPTNIVFENEDVMAFEDVAPMMPVHTLIVPKQHYENIADDVPVEVLGKVFAAVKTVAEIKGVKESGFRVVVNTNDDARQSVHHLHIHVLGGAKMNIGDPKA
ncbi:MAG: HIT domain-containing protein [Eggerthellaceae bacterium]|nr:HIT domain-containing protein [Eggerthellaceae bacterium]